MILPKETMLYRYNLGDNAPEEWSDRFHSPEYEDSKLGFKNQIEAFFFYRDEKTARNVLAIAIDKASKCGNDYNRCTITSCTLTDDLNILDITECGHPMCVLYKLWSEGINVLNGNFIKHDNGAFSFSALAEPFRYIIESKGSESLEEMCKRIRCAKKINDFFHNLVGYTGQLLTDFENGGIFKKLLLEKGYEGYQFDEEPTSPTVCILDSAKLSPPQHTYI